MAISLEDIKKMPPKKMALVCLIAFILIGVVYYFYCYQPALDKKVKLKTDLENIQRQIEARQKVIKQIEQHKKEIASLKENLKVALMKLPEQKEIHNLLTSVSEAGRSMGLEFLLFEPKPPVSKDFYAEIPVKILVKGKYHHVALFFERVAKLPRIVNITDVTIQKDGENQSNLLLADCFIKTYVFVEKGDEEQK